VANAKCSSLWKQYVEHRFSCGLRDFEEEEEELMMMMMMMMMINNLVVQELI